MKKENEKKGEKKVGQGIQVQAINRLKGRNKDQISVEKKRKRNDKMR